MKLKGGFLKGESYTIGDNENTEYCSCILYGKSCKDAKVFRYKTKKAKHSMKVDVLFQYDEAKDAYISVWAFKDTPVARSLSLLRKNERAVIFGRLIKSTRYEEDEELPIVSTYVDPAFIISGRLIETIEGLVASKKFQDMLTEEFESADDYWDNVKEEADKRKAEYEAYKARMKQQQEDDDFGFV